MKNFKNILFVIVLLGFVVNSCQKPERDNPWDELAKLDPQEWAPKNLSIEVLNLSERMLRWDYTGDERITGFRIDRKFGDQGWVSPYALLDKNENLWIDSLLVPDTNFVYTYRLQAIAGNNSSNGIEATTKAVFKAPENFEITKINDFSYRLNWVSNINWSDRKIVDQGFKIDRRINEEDWQKEVIILDKDDTMWVDNSIFSKNSDINVQYRLYAYFESAFSANSYVSDQTRLESPSDLNVQRITIKKALLNWTGNNSGEYGYQIMRSINDSDWEILAKVTDTFYVDETFALNAAVRYRVSSYYGEYLSDYDELTMQSQIPNPEGLSVEVQDETSLTLNWIYNTEGIDGFKIERKINDQNWELITTIQNGSVNSHQVQGLDLENNFYSYRIRAYWGVDESEGIEFPELDFICGLDRVQDNRDGKSYATIQIGEQCWLKENLKYLPNVSPSANGSTSIPHRYVYNYQGYDVGQVYTISTYVAYGVLYNWPAALTACPEGWHLPSEDEWELMAEVFGGNLVAGGHLKTTGTSYWNTPNTGATNESNFDGKGSGSKNGDGIFDDLKNNTLYWTTMEYNSTSAKARGLSYNSSRLVNLISNKSIGYSVRCVKN